MRLRFYFPIFSAAIFAVFLVAFIVANPFFVRAAAVSWDGGGDGSTWSDGTNWSGDSVPGAGDDVTISGTATVNITADLGLTLGSLTLGDDTDDGSDSTVDVILNFQYDALNSGGSAEPLSITNALTVNGDAQISHTANTTSNTYTINISAGSMTVDADSTGAGSNANKGGVIFMDSRGCPGAAGTAGAGPTSANLCTASTAGATASASNSTGGAGYGNSGGRGETADTGGSYYGSVTAPTLLGSSAGSTAGAAGGDGGGYARINVTGTLTLNGEILASGDLGGNAGNQGTGGGSGGAVYITTATMDGTGSITADGGGGGTNNSFDGGGGSGGRIAITYSDTAGSDFSFASGSFSVDGGASPGSPAVAGGKGTVYVKDTTASSVQIFHGFNFDETDHSETNWGFDSSVEAYCESGIASPSVEATGTLTIGGTITCSSSSLTSLNFIAGTALSVTSGATIDLSGSQDGADMDINMAAGDDVTWTNVTISLPPEGFLTVDDAVDIELAGTTALNANTQFTNLTEFILGSSASINTNSLGCQGVANSDGYGPDGSNVCTVATAGYGDGNGAFTGGQGAGHGGAGGNGTLSGAGGTYDTNTAPTLLGSSGGGSSNVAGGHGGGLIRISATTITSSGTYSANGGDGGTSTNQSSGGGSGGSVYISATGTLTMESSTITTTGGAGKISSGFNSGSGGGGMVRIDYVTSGSAATTTHLGTLANTVVAAKGTGGANDGSDGTLSIQQSLIFSTATTSVSSGTSVDTLTIVFNQAVTITDAGGAGDGLDVITLSDGNCSIDNGSYAESGAGSDTLVLNLTCSGGSANDTSITIDPTYTTAGSSTIVDDATSTEMTNASTVTGVDGAAPLFLSAVTGNTPQGPDVNQLVITFSESVTVTDGGTDNDVTLAASSGTASIDAGSYGTTATSLTYTITTSATNDTSTTVDPTYATAGAGDITDANGNEMANGETVTGTDGAEPYAVKVAYSDSDNNGQVDQVDVIFSETLASGSFSYDSSDWSFTEASELTLDDTGASLETTVVSDDTVRLTVSADANETGHTTTPTLQYTNNAGRVQDGSSGQTESWGSVENVTDEALPIITSVSYSDDGDDDGKIDEVTLTFSESVVADSVLAHEDLLINNVGDFTSAAFGSASTDLITGTISSLDISLGTEASVVDTADDSGNFQVTTQNNFQIDDAAGNSRTTLAALPTSIVVDGAEPIISGYTYQDSDGNGKIDRLILAYSETVTGDSVVGDNDILINNVGDFTGAVIGTDASDLITGSTTTTTIDFNTEATVIDTGDASGNFQITTQNNFAITDGNSTNDVLAAVGTSFASDGAAPVISDITYQDADTDGRIDQLLVTFSETLSGANTVLKGSSFGMGDDGDFDGLLFPSGSTDLITSDVSTLTISANESSVVDTAEDSGTMSILLFSAIEAFDLQDADANSNTTNDTITGSQIIDGAAPYPVSSTFYDASSSDGKLDLITTVFSENVSAAADASSDWAVSSSANFASLVEGTVECNSGSAASNECDYNFTTTTEKTDVGDLVLAYVAGTSLTDGTTNTGNLSFSSASSPAFTDGAAPVAIYSEFLDDDGNGTLEALGVEYSENISAVVDGSADWAVSSAANFASLVEGTVECNSGSASADQCLYNFTTSTVKTDAGDLTLTYTAGTSVTDGSNTAATQVFSGGDWTDSAAPVISSRTTLDNDNDGTVDYVKLVFSEAIDDSTVGAAIGYASCVELSGCEPGAINESFTSGTPSSGNETDSANDASIYIGVTSGTQTISSNKTDYQLYIGALGSIPDDLVGNSGSLEVGFTQSDDGAAPVPTTATFYDASSSDGQLDLITVVFTENLAAAADASSDWAISSASNFSSLVEGTVECNSGSAAANECDYNFTTATIKTDVGDLTLAYTAGSSLTDGTNATGSLSFTSASSPAFTDGAAPAAIDSLISIAGGSGTSGAYIVGDVITVTWNNSSTAGDVSSVTADLSGWGGSSTATMTDTTTCSGTSSDDIYEACYTILGSEGIDSTGVNVSVSVTDSSSNNRVGADTTGATVDTVVPTLTAGNLTVTGATGTSGAFKNGDTPVLTWDNTGSGDNNSDTIVSISFNGSNFRSGDTALSGSDSSGTWTANLSGSMDSQDDTSNTISATVTDNAGNTSGPTASTASYTIDTVVPTVTAANISVAGFTGTAGAFKNGDTAIPTWNNTGSGDNNADTIASVSVNAANFAASDTALSASDSSGTWTASLSSGMDSQDDTNNNVTMTVTDNAGNQTVTASTNNYTIDTIAPTLTAGNITVTGATGTSGAFKNGDTGTARWDNSGTGDNNSDTISTVIIDASAFDSGSGSIAGSESAGIFTSTIGTLDSQDDTGNTIDVTIIDDAGNSVGPTTSTATYTVDTIVPVVTTANISVTGATGTSGAFKNGDTAVPTWDVTTEGETDTLASVTFNAANFDAGSTSLSGSLGGGLYTASLAAALDAQDDTSNNVTVTVVDNAGNSTATVGTNNYTIDTVVPVVTSNNVGVTGCSGTSGACIATDTLTLNWLGDTDGETDTIASVTFVATDFDAASSAVSGSDPGTPGTNDWTGSLTDGSPDASQDDTGNQITVTVVDNAGNSTGPVTSTLSYIVDNIVPTLSSQVYQDANTDGTVDQILLTFSEDVSNGFTADKDEWTFPQASELTLVAPAADLNVTNSTTTVTLTVGADSNETGHATTPTLSYTNTAGTLQDDAGNPVANFVGQSLTDDAAPVVISRITDDNDTNGQIDRITVTYTEDLNGSSVAGIDYTVAGFTVDSALESSAGVVTVTLTESGSSDTGATPSVTSGAGIRDLWSNDAILSTASATDGANPVIISRTYLDNGTDGSVDRLSLVFSESVTHNGSDLDQWSVTANDLTGLGDPTALTSGSGTTTLVYTIPATTNRTGTYIGETEPTLEYTQSATSANRIQDGVSNELASEGSATSILDGAAPRVYTAYTVDTDANGQIDQVIGTFTEHAAMLSTTDFEIDGSVGNSSSAGSDPYQITVNFTESGSSDTDRTPTLEMVTAGFQDDATSPNTNDNHSITVTDQAAPVMVSASPTSGANHIPAVNDFTITFSEPIDTGSFSLSESPSLVAGSFSYAWDGTDETVTVSPGTYNMGTTVTHTITAPDVPGNAYGGANYEIYPLMPSSSGGGGGGGAANVGNTVSVVADTVSLVSPSAPVNTGSLNGQSSASMRGGDSYDIVWTTSGNINNVSLYYSVDGGNNYAAIVSGTDNDGSYSWTVPNTATTQGYIKIVGRDAGAATLATDVSEVPYAISINAILPLEGAPETDESSTTSGSMDIVSNVPIVEVTLVDGTTMMLMSGHLFRGETLTGVYLVDQDGKRRVFPSESVYFSYYSNFDDVVMVKDDQLQKLSIGRRVTMASGRMVKIQSNPNVYQVHDGGLLRLVPDEATAISFYGDAWNTLITDIAPTFWGDYTQGEPLESTE